MEIFYVVLLPYSKHIYQLYLKNILLHLFYFPRVSLDDNGISVNPPQLHLCSTS